MHCLYTKVCQNYFSFEQLSALVYTPKMGRGRKGPLEQSTKKPKVRKNKEKVNWSLFQPHRIGENKELPILVSEDLLAEMKKISTQNLMNILLPNQCEQCH